MHLGTSNLIYRDIINIPWSNDQWPLKMRQLHAIETLSNEHQLMERRIPAEQFSHWVLLVYEQYTKRLCRYVYDTSSPNSQLRCFKSWKLAVTNVTLHISDIMSDIFTIDGLRNMILLLLTIIWDRFKTASDTSLFYFWKVLQDIKTWTSSSDPLYIRRKFQVNYPRFNKYPTKN